MVLDRTPFYAESGGQVGDRGELAGVNGTFLVEDTQKIQPTVFGHKGAMRAGNLKAGDKVLAAVDTERRARCGAVAGMEARGVDARVVDCDLWRVDADRRHVAAHRFGYRKQTRGPGAGFDHLRSCRGAMAEMADVGAARLRRKGEAERVGHAHRGRAVGVEELRIDDVEFAIAHRGEDPARNLRGIEARTVARDQREARAQDGDAVPLLGSRQAAKRAVAPVQRQRKGRQADRRDDGEFNPGLCGERAQAFLDEQAEVRPRGVGEQRRDAEDAEGLIHARPLRRLCRACRSTVLPCAFREKGRPFDKLRANGMLL